MIDYQYERDRRDRVIGAIKEDIRAELESVVQSIHNRWRVSIELYSISSDTIIEMLKNATKELK